MRKLCGILLALAAPLSMSATGCMTAVDAEEVAESEGGLTLAEAHLEDGSRYEFIELEEGEMVIIAHHPSIEAASAAIARAEDETVVSFYERLTGEAAPDALVDAELRALELGAELAPLEDELAALEGLAEEAVSFSGDDEVASASSALTYGEFSNNYCSGSSDYLFCFPSTGNAWCQRRGLTMSGSVYANSGGVYVRMRYKTITGWHTHRYEYAPKGTVVSMANAYFLARRWRRFEVVNNHQNRHLYFSCRGSN